MSHLLLVVLFLFSNIAVFAQDMGIEREFDVEKSVFYAERNRKEILVAEKEIELARERIKEANSFNFPKIDLTFNYSELNTDQMMVLPPSFSSILLPVPAPDSLNHYFFTRLSLWQQLYTGGRYSSNLKLADSSLKRAELQLIINKNDIGYEAKKSYYNLLYIEKKIQLYSVIISSIETIVASAYGPSFPNPANQLTDKQIQIFNILSGIKKDYEILQNNYFLSRLDFLNTLGIELDTEFRITGSFEPIIREYDVNKLGVWSFQYRSEPKMIQLQEQVDALGMKLSMAMRYPTVTLGAQYEYAGEELKFAEKNWNATINMYIPIFDGWAYWSRVRQKDIQVRQNKLNMKDIEDTIRLQLQKAFNDYNYRCALVKSTQKELIRWESLHGSVNRYDTNSIVEWYKSYLTVQQNYMDSVFYNLVAYASLEHSLGKSLEE